MTTPNTTIATFYRFVDLPDYENLREPLLTFCEEQGLRGSILLASEGINSTISGTAEAVQALHDWFDRDERLAGLWFKTSQAERQPFGKMKVRLKQEIVSLGAPHMDMSKCGTYVSPDEWSALIRDPDVLVIDTRNPYEYDAGHFEGAVVPDVPTFRDFPEWAKRTLDPSRHRKVAMYCTGGIRCEKSTTWMKEQGFEEVYHLEGGILNYFEQTKNQDNAWQGSCFVFDERAMVDAELNPVDATDCPQCGNEMSAAEVLAGTLPQGLRCPDCLPPEYKGARK